VDSIGVAERFGVDVALKLTQILLLLLDLDQCLFRQSDFLDKIFSDDTVMLAGIRPKCLPGILDVFLFF
jgi:hypothetical protein